ncbi:helix-turn-helix domain-containing protein [Ruegeria sp. WL0004]|uniref:Helix-turn-helix domain-containing protein n=1 Tax=Ruegeria marisflavi TaxID=2984152 RepID=A0ABT2WQQ3_9RHOB|nr:helix-turn-helix domain-containing protein [Ruegeria sp. WL0004]MCU9837567.1 helix-turn-helix domain-containing protein [Ruegeria sp. WL0004]
MQDDLLTSNETAELLGIRPETLCRWRKRGDGPRFTKAQSGQWLRYRRSDVLAWLAGRHAA